MKIEWKDFGNPLWETKKDKEEFIKKFEEEIWPIYYSLFKDQSVNALGVNAYTTLTKNTNTRIDFEITPGEKTIIHIYVYPWYCTHKPEHIAERFKKDENDDPWLIGRCCVK